MNRFVVENEFNGYRLDKYLSLKGNFLTDIYQDAIIF